MSDYDSNNAQQETLVTPPEASLVPNEQERQLAMFTHLSALLGGLLTSGMGAFIGPLIIWLIKKDSMPFVDDQGKEALNFNITVAIIAVIGVVFTFITFGVGVLLTVPLLIAVGVAWIVLSIIACIKASEGIRYRYPLTLRLIK